MADKPPAAKLPLAVRKNVRDAWEHKIAEHEAELEKLLGTTWKFDIDPLAIYPYAAEGSYGQTSLGDCINSYAEGFISQLKGFLDSHGPELKDELNSVASEHKIGLKASKKFSYCGCDIEDGVLRIHFSYDYLGTNIHYAASTLPDVVSSAPQPSGAPPLSFAARHSIKKDYVTAIDDVLAHCRKILHNPNLKFEPGFEALGAKLKTGKDVRDDWERNLGSFAVSYYQSFESALNSNEFETDEMLREGFEEGAPNGVIRLRLVDKLSCGYCEIVLDNGDIVMQTTPANWGTNVYNCASKLVDIL